MLGDSTIVRGRSSAHGRTESLNLPSSPIDADSRGEEQGLAVTCASNRTLRPENSRLDTLRPYDTCCVQVTDAVTRPVRTRFAMTCCVWKTVALTRCIWYTFALIFCVQKTLALTLYIRKTGAMTLLVWTRFAVAGIVRMVNALLTHV